MKKIATASQKVHHHGTDGNRYFWNVKIAGSGSMVYRSRHASATGVITELAKHGRKVRAITPAA